MRVAHLFGLDDAGWDEAGLFFVTIAALVALVVVGTLNPPLLSSTLTGAYNWVMHYFGWWFMALGGVLLVFGLFMTLSRYGKIRIGGEDADPEFGFYSWIAMVFTVGFGSSIIVWGVGEPIQIVNSPPPTLPVGGTTIKPLSLAFMFLHESFPGMAMWYIPVALSFALIVYTGSVSEYKLSSMLDVALDREEYGWLYWLVDLSALVAMVGGIATTLGFTVQQLSTILDVVYGLQATALTYGLAPGHRPGLPRRRLARASDWHSKRCPTHHRVDGARGGHAVRRRARRSSRSTSGSTRPASGSTTSRG